MIHFKGESIEFMADPGYVSLVKTDAGDWSIFIQGCLVDRMSDADAQKFFSLQKQCDFEKCSLCGRDMAEADNVGGAHRWCWQNITGHLRPDSGRDVK